MEAWKRKCRDTSPDALMFSTFGRGERTGTRVPLGTDLQKHGTMKDAQGILRHSCIKVTADVYMQDIPESARAAINSRTRAVLAEKTEEVKQKAVRTSGATHPNAPQFPGAHFVSA